jgi:hypothetical protein
VPDATGDGLVQVAYLHSDDVSHSFMDSWDRLKDYDREAFGRITRTKGRINLLCGTGQLVLKRNYAVKLFLDGTPHEWLWMVDTDMGFAPDTVERLIDAAHPVDRPVVGALCFTLTDKAYDGMGGLRVALIPTIYRMGYTKDGRASFCHFGDYPAASMVQVATTGAACILLHRSVLEKVRAEHGDHWFDQMYDQAGDMVGEDFALCMRMGALGIPIWVHTGIQTTHKKSLWLGEDDYRLQVGPPPPADTETAVIVPVMRRPHQAMPFMASLRASTGLATVYAVADEDDLDTVAAWAEAGAMVLIRPGSAGTFAEKVNLGYRATAEPWLFIAGDDVRFTGGWLDHAQHTARLSGAKVIGTNDTVNPRVLAGEHATHLLIDREYVDEVGASWDGPGVVAHEGYRHWFVDDELVYASKQRGVWAMATQSVVPHLHPMWTGGEQDEVYELGQSHAEHDRKMFARRCKTHLGVEVEEPAGAH